jgi:hypothetical protein
MIYPVRVSINRTGQSVVTFVNLLVFFFTQNNLAYFSLGTVLKDTVSPDIGYNFRFWKIKPIPVLSVELLMNFTFLFYVVSDIFKLTF